jgi:uncharacterized membrane protein YraQ (UPF0718 family)
VLAGAGLAAWALVYSRLETFASWLAHPALGLPRDSHAGAAVEFFAYDAPKILLLLTLVSFGVGVLRSFLSPARMRALLAGRRQFAGNVLAAGLGVLTPFCSCSAVSLFVGLVSAGVPLGVTFSFLIAAPMVNEVALALLFATFGWKVAGLYLGTGLAIAIGAGWVLGRLGLENSVEEWARAAADAEPAETRPDWPARLGQGAKVMREVVGRAWPWVLLGIAVGAGIHGYVPEQALASVLGRQAWWSVPLAVALGVPMYANAAGVIPIMQALLGKGAALGTTLAFIMSVVALSLPEALLLRQVLKPRLIAVFFGIVSVGILGVGWLFNLLF